MLKPKRVIENEFNYDWGLCVWRLSDGTYLKNRQGDFLSVGPARLNNTIAERNLTRAAKSCGVTSGAPFWLPGFRKVSENEWCDQMERLMDGNIPDAADLYIQSKHG